MVGGAGRITEGSGRVQRATSSTTSFFFYVL